MFPLSSLKPLGGRRVPAPATPHGSVSVGDHGFEVPGVSGPGYQYNPAGSAWTFSPASGLSGNHSAFTVNNPDAPEGVQVAFVQAGDGSLTVTGSFVLQVLTFPVTGSYTLTVMHAQRDSGGVQQQAVRVQVDGVGVDTITTVDSNYLLFSTTFGTTAGDHTLAFVGLNPLGGDNTMFLDDVQLTY